MNIFYLFYLASTPFSGYNKKQKLTDSEVSGMGRNATLKDVAEKVGLSVASVSLVLNQNQTVFLWKVRREFSRLRNSWDISLNSGSPGALFKNQSRWA